MIEQSNIKPVLFLHEERTSSYNTSHCVMQRSMVHGSMSYQRVSPWFDTETKARTFLNSFAGKGN